PLHEREFSQMVDVEQLFGFGRGQITSAGAEELERIPLGCVVAGADGDSAGNVQAIDGVLDDGSGRDAEVDHIVAASQKRGDHAFPDHGAAAPRIASDDYRSRRIEEGAECGCEVDYVGRRE